MEENTKLYRFRVTCGRYRGIDGLVYTKGDEVRTFFDLRTKFANAFELIGEEPPQSEFDLPDFPIDWRVKKTGRWCHIVNGETGEKLTDKAMTKKDADAFCNFDFADLWEPIPIWKGQTVYVIGGGPSVRDLDLSPIHGSRCMGVNDAYAMGDWVDACFFWDVHWINHHGCGFAEWPGMRITNNPAFEEIPGIYRMKKDDSPDGPGLKWYYNSGAAAVLLAAKLGSSKIVLLGFDMQLSPSGDSNWHPNNLNTNTEKTYAGFMLNCETLRDDMEAFFPKVEVVNANPDSALELWPRVPFEEVLP